MKYKMTVLLACALLLSNGWARAADKMVMSCPGGFLMP